MAREGPRARPPERGESRRAACPRAASARPGSSGKPRTCAGCWSSGKPGSAAVSPECLDVRSSRPVAHTPGRGPASDVTRKGVSDRRARRGVHAALRVDAGVPLEPEDRRRSVCAAQLRGILARWRRRPAGDRSASSLMTRRISAGGRLLLERLLTSRVNSRTFSMAITAWAAKVSSSAICLSVNGRPRRVHGDRADRLALAKHRTARPCGSRAIRGEEAYSGSAAMSSMWRSRPWRLRRGCVPRLAVIARSAAPTSPRGRP